MVRPDRVPVLQALRIVPHTVAVDDLAANSLADRQHAAIDMGRHACDHMFRRRPQAFDRPALADEIVIAADAARSHDDSAGVDLEFSDDVAGTRSAARRRITGQKNAGGTRHRSVGHGQAVDLMPEKEGELALFRCRLGAAHEGREHAGARAPGDMETRDRVAMSIGMTAATLGPSHHRKPADTLGFQPATLLAGGKLQIGLCPLARPEIFRAVEGGGSEPVLPCQLQTVTNTHPPLFGTVDKEQPAQRPESLSAEVLLAFLIDHPDLQTAIGSLGCGDETGQPSPDDEYIEFPHAFLPTSFFLLLRARKQGRKLSGTQTIAGGISARSV